MAWATVNRYGDWVYRNPFFPAPVVELKHKRFRKSMFLVDRVNAANPFEHMFARATSGEHRERTVTITRLVGKPPSRRRLVPSNGRDHVSIKFIPSTYELKFPVGMRRG